MDALRRSKLRHIIDTRFGGDRGLFLARTKISKGRLSQLLDPTEPFGERAGKALAGRLGLPAGYFEQMDPATLQWAVAFDALSPSVKEKWADLVKMLGAEPHG